MSIGYVCKYVPVEALEAMGARMERIEPDESLVSFDAAETCMHANMCSFAKAAFETIVAGNFDGIVLTTCCDSMRRLADALRAQAPSLFIHVLDVPRDTGDAACALYERNVRKLLCTYGEFADATFSEEALFAQLGGTICSAEGTCDSPLELNYARLHSEASQPSFRLTKSSSASQDSTYNDQAADSAAWSEGCEASERNASESAAAPQVESNRDQVGDAGARSEGCEASERSATAAPAVPQVDNALQPKTHFSLTMPNVGIAGARANPEIRRILESRGVNIAFDITCTNANRHFAPQKADALTHYVHDVLTQLPCARMRDISPRKAFLDYALPQVDGLIYHTVQFCDLYSYEYSELKRTSSTPMLALETDCTAQSRGQMLTRLEAFLESIGALQTERLTSQKGSPMSTAATFVVGLDSGSTSTNAVVMNEAREIVASVVARTGAKAGASAERAYREVLERANITPDQVGCTIATGYGRVSIPFADENVTEISCHGRGAHYFNPDVRTILDIGGQDSKAIHVNAAGEVTDFAMNDKCAAGTGRFLEMIARSLEIDLDELGPAALESKKHLEIASMCSVFAESEVISLIANNEEKPDIAAGVCRAVAGKAYSLMRRVGLEGAYMMTGGVAQNPGVVRAVEELIGDKLFICDDPEIVGATGAALLALEKSE
ncbi:acyl-CoA dehydratase activase [uncultured Ellagibacter sp.]|uniref:acyl-CoA dehydratase activase n=1 Tax=uncultured Ellagibacter sp. TaxID=2137580 RepID=UPI002633CB23|nr:acyl-CoA dehydratase activase [uncultured Ellagibacter sp.]